ncbi:dihydroorotase [Bacillaceae bacterium S4-13-56]
MKLFIDNGKMLNREGFLEEVSLSIEDGKIHLINPRIPEFDQRIDAKGQAIFPGFVDIHVHLREPGGETKETIETGSKAAARGGFTTICPMPNTRPVPDSIENLKLILDRIKDTAHVRVLPYASITTRQLGKEITPMEELKVLGAVAFTDDGVGVQEAGKMLEAMEKAKELEATIVAHCEDNTLIQGGAIHKGQKSKELSIPGIPSICESVQIARDVLLSEATGCRYHVCHVSTKESVRVIRDAKKAGIPVTAEVSPHHLLLTEDDIPGDNANFKMNPPLRGEGDRLALMEGLLDGTIDCIATDHAPHTEPEKSEGMLHAPFGIVGSETAFPLLYTHFVETGIFTLQQVVEWLTIKPSQIFNLPFGTIKEGSTADIVLVDLALEEEIDKNTFYSKGKNTPFHGWNVKGIPTMTLVEGELVYKKEDYYANSLARS